MKFRAEQDKYDTVIQKNTFYLIDREIEEDYEGYVILIPKLLDTLKCSVYFVV